MMLFIVTRGIGLLAGEPSADDDVYRYLWTDSDCGVMVTPAGAPLAYFSSPYQMMSVGWLIGLIIPSLPLCTDRSG